MTSGKSIAHLKGIGKAGQWSCVALFFCSADGIFQESVKKIDQYLEKGYLALFSTASVQSNKNVKLVAAHS